jgi:hypothetical protein
MKPKKDRSLILVLAIIGAIALIALLTNCRRGDYDRHPGICYDSQVATSSLSVTPNPELK